MKLALVLILALGLVGCDKLAPVTTGHERHELGIVRPAEPIRPVSKTPDIFLDNVGDTQPSANFIDAFAQEPACTGLSLGTWDGRAPADQIANSKARWTVHPVSYSTGDTIVFMHYDRKYLSTVVTDTPEKAAKQVCEMVKGKGGRIQ